MCSPEEIEATFAQKFSRTAILTPLIRWNEAMGVLKHGNTLRLNHLRCKMKQTPHFMLKSLNGCSRGPSANERIKSQDTRENDRNDRNERKKNSLRVAAHLYKKRISPPYSHRGWDGILSHDSACHRARISLPNCILTPRLPPAARLAPATKTAAKWPVVWGGGGGDGWSVVESRYQIAKGENRNEKKEEWWELEKALDKGQRAPKEWWWGSGDLPVRGKALNLFICSAVLSLHLQLSPLCGVILFRLPLFFSQPRPVPLGLGFFFLFFFVCKKKKKTTAPPETKKTQETTELFKIFNSSFSREASNPFPDDPITAKLP